MSGKGTRSYARNLMISLTVGSLATAAAAWWYYERQLTAMEEQVIQQLRAVSDSKTEQLLNWRAERLGDGYVLLSSAMVSKARKIISGSGTPEEASQFEEVLRRFESAFEYSGAVLCDLQGRIRLTSGNPAADPIRLQDLARAAGSSPAAQLADLSLDPRSGRPLMALLVPIEKSGVLIVDIDPERFLYPYLNAWSGPSQSAETLLVRREGDDALYLSDMRGRPGAPLRYRRTLKGVKIPSEEQLLAGTVYRNVDYRGKHVISFMRRIRNTPWYITAKIDEAEADQPEYRLGWEMAAITGLIALLNLAGAVVIWRARGARIQQERLEWFRAVANDTPAYLWMADPRFENSFINAPLAKFLGTNESHLRAAWTEAVHPDDAEKARTLFRDHMARQTGYTQEYRIRRYDGEYRWVISKAVPRFSSKGVFQGFAGSILDVTGRRLAERRLREANESLQKLSSRLIGAQEEERKRLARELHDDLTQEIAAISLATGSLKRQIPKDCSEAREQADAIHAKLVHLAEGVRRMSHELHPAVLQYLGLEPALRSYCEEFGALTGLEIALEIEGSFEGIAPDAALCLFRVAQEALRNVVKHAGVSKAAVDLRRAGGHLILRITDEGAGMETGAATGKAGLGLLNIRERARLVRGKATFRSAPGEGTTVTVELPEAQKPMAQAADQTR